MMRAKVREDQQDKTNKSAWTEKKRRTGDKHEEKEMGNQKDKQEEKQTRQKVNTPTKDKDN